MTQREKIYESIQKLEKWISDNEWKAYDPFDGLSTKISKYVTFENHYLRIALQQTVRRFIFNLRPILGIPKQTSSKGMGFCALGYLNLYQATQEDQYLKKTKFCLDWLTKNYSRDYSGYAWGNHFDYEARGGSIPRGIPTIVWTGLIANVFLDAHEILDGESYFNIARSAGDFILNDIGRYQNAEDELCFGYTPTSEECIHNANVLGGCLIARLYKYTKDETLFAIAKKSFNYTLKHQLESGGWYYGEAKKYHWVDSFHSGYVLESTYEYMNATGDRTFEDKFKKGFQHFLSTFFEEDGTPRYYDYKTYPIDIQCASQGIQTLVNLSEYDQGALELAQKVAMWTIENMQDKQGYFYFRKYPLFTNKTPMFHWGQATMLAALTSLLNVNEAKV
jgi:rhamnogalacturonyl hydrolase YesR